MWISMKLPGIDPPALPGPFVFCLFELLGNREMEYTDVLCDHLASSDMVADPLPPPFVLT